MSKHRLQIDYTTDDRRNDKSFYVKTIKELHRRGVSIEPDYYSPDPIRRLALFIKDELGLGHCRMLHAGFDIITLIFTPMQK